jgi:hypothetical protein
MRTLETGLGGGGVGALTGGALNAFLLEQYAATRSTGFLLAGMLLPAVTLVLGVVLQIVILGGIGRYRRREISTRFAEYKAKIKGMIRDATPAEKDDLERYLKKLTVRELDMMMTEVDRTRRDFSFRPKVDVGAPQ